MSWTLRPQRTRDLRRGEQQEHTAALRATRYVRRHAWQFHGAGVKEAVRELVVPMERFAWASQKAQEGVASVLAAFQVPAELASGPVKETAHRLTVVGWKYGSWPRYVCLEHRPTEGVPVTAADVTASTECDDCGTRLLGPAVAPAQCPDCSHAHVEGQNCTSEMGVGFCGCTG